MRIRINKPTVKAVVDRLPSDSDCPSVVESEVSSLSSIHEVPAFIQTTQERKQLKWEFHGLTLWLEFEEFDNDLTMANEFLSSKYGLETIPRAHATAIYGMEHLSEEEAKKLLTKVPSILKNGIWPKMERPVAVKQDISEEGKPGQVCTVAWAELSLRTNSEHEEAMDALYELFGMGERKSPWTPHISLAYDNPDESVMQLSDIIGCAMRMPSLLQNERQVKAISLWSTAGKMSDWKLLERVSFFEDLE